ncbi:MAG TPA: hypothetical protein VEP90_01600 [Methylomirabilota bacterium]|nr:hypothetical protein [Methylomirabilota bacterium]
MASATGKWLIEWGWDCANWKGVSKYPVNDGFLISTWPETWDPAIYLNDNYLAYMDLAPYGGEIYWRAIEIV